MDDVRSNLTQDASAWNFIKYAIDPTLGSPYMFTFPFINMLTLSLI